MTLSQIIKLRTDSGGDIVDFLVDVMQDQYEDFLICHRLQAARLLTTYGNEDAPDFIADNTSESSPRRDRPNSKRQTKFDTELARLIREDTDDGRSIARFLVNVMVGELRSFRPHHRMAAARELLNRGFGKSAHNNPPNRRSGEGRDPEIHAENGLQPRSAEALTPQTITNRHSRESGNPPDGSPLGHPGAGDPLTPHSSPLTPQREAPPLTPHSSPLTPQREAPPLTPQRKAPPLTPHSSPLTPQRKAPPLTPQSQAPPLTPNSSSLTPRHFEHTVLDLLENMGYGHARHVGRTGDGDIDGIIDQDVLGLKRLYVQAKRWTNQVGESEIRNFSGSLDAHGATRGILITTSDFTDTARKTAKTISIGTKHIRLVNGHELAHLMLKHSIRVTPDTPQHSRKQDENHHTHPT